MGNQALTTSREILYIPVDKITTNPYQPRKFFDKQSIEELAGSIRQYGVLQPVTVRLNNNMQYELVAGERRLRAAKAAGLSTIPAIMSNIGIEDSAIIAIIENLQRQDLNYIEEAEGFVNLMEDYSFTQEALARKINKSQSTIANKIRLLKLSKRVRRLLLEEGLSERHARALLKLPCEEEQLKVIKHIVEDNLTVANTEKLIEEIIQPKEKKKKRTKIKYRIKDFRIFENSIKQTVEAIKSSGFKADFNKSEKEGSIEFTIRINV